jgi:hypothetical protein
MKKKNLTIYDIRKQNRERAKRYRKKHGDKINKKRMRRYYDEKHHFKNGKLVDKDIKRMQHIINHLKCKFIRLNDVGEVYMIKEYQSKL